MGKELIENYQKVWANGCGQLIANLQELGVEKNALCKETNTVKCLSFSLNGLRDMTVDVEFDESKEQHKYGIYFGIRTSKDNKEELSLNKIWKTYKSVIFPGKDIERNMVFHTDDDSCDSPRKWIFWIRLNDDDKLEDVAGRMWLIGQLCLMQQVKMAEI